MKPRSRSHTVAGAVAALSVVLVGLAPVYARAADGDRCDDGQACTSDDRIVDGRCRGEPYRCDDGLSCTRDTCDGAGGCRHELEADHCLIDGGCHAGGSSDAKNPCRVCEPSHSVDAWDAPSGRPCLGGVCRNGRCNVTLSVQTKGAGSGVVLGKRMLCDDECDVELPVGTRVHLSAEPSRDSQFEGWGGACSGTGGCVLEMRTGSHVFASFGRRAPAAPPVQLIVETEGDGIVTSFPAGVDCGSHCWHTFPHGTTVTLYATPRKGMQFRGWRGGCRGRSRECSVELRVAQMISARFGRPLPARRRPGSAEPRPGVVRPGGPRSSSDEPGSRERAAAVEIAGPPAPTRHD
jgi:hypothetical protein